MIKLLIKKFILDYENVSNKNVREKYGVLAGSLGIACNLLLFILNLNIKLFRGIWRTVPLIPLYYFSNTAFILLIPAELASSFLILKIPNSLVFFT